MSRSSSPFSAFPSSGTLRLASVRASILAPCRRAGGWSVGRGDASRGANGIHREGVLATPARSFMRQTRRARMLLCLVGGYGTYRRVALLTGGRRMHLLDRIETQLIANRLPLVAITVAAVPYVNTPVPLTLHLDTIVETRVAEVSDPYIVEYLTVGSTKP